MLEDFQDRTTVHIYTAQFVIVGDIAMFADTRLTDYMISAHDFIAVTDARVRDIEGRPLFKSRFLNIQKDKVIMITPAEALQLP